MTADGRSGVSPGVSAEPVRLVIWDLDETFWHGTLTEGGIRFNPEACRLVVDLARRGIMSSICSKNDMAQVQAILEAEGLWAYFLFPSIDWTPKGSRIAALIDAMRLRPATVLFIDDNPSNLEEARRSVPGIQVAGHDFIAGMAAHPLLAGKDDAGLTRLAHYKALEHRRLDAPAAASDVTDFLRASDIRVALERNVEDHLDRMIELINRTNQLNFTKIRLPDDAYESRREIEALLHSYNIQAALIRVSDRYGDHGFCGVYVYNSLTRRLIHFCFSCRILGMGVEQWVYGLLQRPTITVSGEVLSDLFGNGPAVDWINQPIAGNDQAMRRAPGGSGRLVAHGGCDLAAVTHYLTADGMDIVPEFNIARNGMSLRVDHSVFLTYAMRSLTDSERTAAESLQYREEDFRTALFDPAIRPDFALLSFASDAHIALYRHRATGMILPCIMGLGPVFQDARRHAVDELPVRTPGDKRRDVLQALKDDFDFLGLTEEEGFKQTLAATFERLSDVSIFVLRPNDFHLHHASGTRRPAGSFSAINRWTEEVAALFPQVRLIDIIGFVEDDAEIQTILHFHRKVYFRIYEHLKVFFFEKKNQKTFGPPGSFSPGAPQPSR